MAEGTAEEDPEPGEAGAENLREQEAEQAAVRDSAVRVELRTGA